ncbi:hypothetical protein L6452_13496 [Arctium lappa]|uniref:Uncharacterized protein n=1 Tax=Arctium lappa TaxID=4217 RepID=A0ACB9CIH7_ARCLA|nr:hypothetical protein L6452_13496 [Arctium lappa]
MYRLKRKINYIHLREGKVLVIVHIFPGGIRQQSPGIHDEIERRIGERELIFTWMEKKDKPPVKGLRRIENLSLLPEMEWRRMGIVYLCFSSSYHLFLWSGAKKTNHLLVD